MTWSSEGRFSILKVLPPQSPHPQLSHPTPPPPPPPRTHTYARTTLPPPPADLNLPLVQPSQPYPTPSDVTLSSNQPCFFVQIFLLNCVRDVIFHTSFTHWVFERIFWDFMCENSFKITLPLSLSQISFDYFICSRWQLGISQSNARLFEGSFTVKFESIKDITHK